MENSKIEWTTHTFNPWIGCTKVSPGCANCYAETLMAVRYGKVKWGKGQPRVRTAPENWRKPRLWNKAAAGASERPRVFCASLADVFDEEVSSDWLAELMQLIDDCKNLDWLLLTKRPQNITRLMQRIEVPGHGFGDAWNFADSMPNVWLGTSVEDQHRADTRIPELLKVAASTYFLSMEPLLEEVDIRQYLLSDYDKAAQDDQLFGPLEGWNRRKIDWVIVGGESGPGARIMKEQWALSIRDQCDEWSTPFHFKQWGGRDKKAAGRVLDGQTYDELPTPRVLQYS